MAALVSTANSEYIAEVLRAAKTTSPFIVRTPLIHSEPLSQLTGGDVFLKLENLQRTGSFKVRGAAHRMSSLDGAEAARGVVTCSSGNHGRAVAYVAKRLGIAATICVPRWVDPVKLQAIRQSGAAVDTEAVDYDAAEQRALEIERTQRLTFVHPFDDPHILAGQGTLGLEVLEDEPVLNAILGPLSGGGLMAGIGLAVEAKRASCRVDAVSAQNANVMVASLAAGKPVSLPEQPSIANALSGGIGLANKHTFQLVQTVVDTHVTVAERDIGSAIRFLAERHRMVAEGGGATALAAVLVDPVRYHNERIAVVVSGGNIDLSEWMRVLND